MLLLPVWYLRQTRQLRKARNEVWYTVYQFLSTSFWLGLLLTLACYTWYWSLQATVLNVNTAIYQSQSAVVFVLSVAFFGEQASIGKVLSLALSIAGVTATVYAPTTVDVGSEVQSYGIHHPRPCLLWHLLAIEPSHRRRTLILLICTLHVTFI